MTIDNGLAPTPPMGWNSWDCYGTTVREDEVKANADFMAARLARHGWEYIVVDIQWYEPNAKAGGYRPNADLVMDEWGRLTPATNRFPSAAHGVGFKPLADYVHSLGLKFGIHIMRGIPHRAVKRNLPILNTPYRAQDIADFSRICPWNDDMVGIDTNKPGAQEYYDSIVDLYASWDVDFIKADDMLYPYHAREIEALAKAIRRSGRDIVLSLSPGVDLSTEHADHLSHNCEMYRISADFWDRWQDLYAQFDLCKKWQPYIQPGCFPDADMLPLGHIGIRAERGADRQSLLTRDEQMTLMTLWVMFRSPLMFGGDLPTSDEFAISLLTNDEVLAIHPSSRGNRELLREGNFVAWTADSTESDDTYLALFNIGDAAGAFEIDLSRLDGGARYAIRDLWQRTDIGEVEGTLTVQLAPHAAKLYRLRAVM